VSALVFSRANIDLFFPFTAVIFEFDLILPFPVTCISPIHLYLIFEKSSLKNQVQQTGFLTCKNQFQN